MVISYIFSVEARLILFLPRSALLASDSGPVASARR